MFDYLEIHCSIHKTEQTCVYGCDLLFCLFFCYLIILDSYFSENAVVPIKFECITILSHIFLVPIKNHWVKYGQTPKVIRGISMRLCTQQK